MSSHLHGVRGWWHRPVRGWKDRRSGATDGKPPKQEFQVIAAGGQPTPPTISAPEHTSKILRTMPDTVVAVSISEDKSLIGAGAVSGVACVWSSETGTQLNKIELKSGVNAIQFCGRGEETSLIIATFGGFINSFFSGAPLSNGDKPPTDTRKYTGVEGNKRAVYCLGTNPEGGLLIAGGTASIVIFRCNLHRAVACELTEIAQVVCTGDVLSVALDDSGTFFASGEAVSVDPMRLYVLQATQHACHPLDTLHSCALPGTDKKAVEVWTLGGWEDESEAEIQRAASFVCKTQVALNSSINPA